MPDSLAAAPLADPPTTLHTNITDVNNHAIQCSRNARIPHDHAVIIHAPPALFSIECVLHMRALDKAAHISIIVIIIVLPIEVGVHPREI